MTKQIQGKPIVCLLASADTSPSVLYGLYDVLSTAGAIYAEMTNTGEVEPLLDVKIVAAQSEPFRCFGNVIVEPQKPLQDIQSADVVVVCDMYQPVDIPPHGRYPEEIA